MSRITIYMWKKQKEVKWNKEVAITHVDDFFELTFNWCPPCWQRCWLGLPLVSAFIVVACQSIFFPPQSCSRQRRPCSFKGKGQWPFPCKKKPSLLSVITRLSHQVCDDPSFRSRRLFKSRRAVQVSMVTGSLNDNKRVLFFYSGLLRYQVNMGSASPQGQWEIPLWM